VKLAELDASFVSVDERRVAVQFRCPGCRRERIVIPFANPPDGGPASPDMNRRGVLWQRTGETLETLTLTPSIDFRHTIPSDRSWVAPRVCHWHGWVRNGEAVSC
jgi:hypothetical protein